MSPAVWRDHAGQLSAQHTAYVAGRQLAMHTRRKRRSTAVTLVGILLLVLGQAAVAQALNATTAPGDATALSSLLGGLAPQTGSILSTWQADKDPCSSWEGVICSCDGLPIRSLAATCAGTFNSSAAQRRVLGLDLGPMANRAGQKLEGPINPAIGNLQGLLYLDLSNNELTGTLPDTMSSLSKLQWLLLDNNQLSGPLPAYLGGLPNLQQAQLQNNNFSGPVPQQWCTGTATFHVMHNPNLCGSVPSCARVNDVSGTFLSSLNSVGAICDNTPPDCDLNVGCIIWSPKYWTSRSIASFNFTGFLDYESGPPYYQWGIGTREGLVDVVPLMNVTATRVLKDVRYEGGVQKMMVTPVLHNLTTLALVEGQRYYATVVAWNGAGPPLSINVSSEPIMVDTTGPESGEVYNLLANKQYATTSVRDRVQASWDPFIDRQSGVTNYTVDFLQVITARNGSTIYKNLTNQLSFKPDTTRIDYPLQQSMPEGTVYVIQVTATNAANLTTSTRTLPVTVTKPGPPYVSAGYAALIGVLCSIVCLALGAVAAVFVQKHRMRMLKQKEQRQAEDKKQLKALMLALSAHEAVDQCDADGPPALDDPIAASKGAKSGFGQYKEAAFVFTDIENSTDLSQQNRAAFLQVQEVHDHIMREGIAKFGGYEIMTEGDSFQVAFATCQQAMAFCVDIQQRLQEQAWPKDVVAMNACKPIIDPLTGDVLYAGPRIRMGVHWGGLGDFVSKSVDVTRAITYEGPAIKVIQTVSDAANGGQIVLTDDAVMRLAEDMCGASFPVIELLGLFKLTETQHIWLYGSSGVVGKPGRREFAPLRKLVQAWPSAGDKVPFLLKYNIIPGPVPNSKGALVFVSMRLSTWPKDKVCDLPKNVAAKFEHTFATTAQQFRGYLFAMDSSSFARGMWHAAFSSSMDALRFSHAAQMLLMYLPWPLSEKGYCGKTLPSPDGRYLFIGPRVTMTLHESSEYFVVEDAAGCGQGENCRPLLSFHGPALAFGSVLTYCARGGQILLSEAAWESVKPTIFQHPGAVQVKSMGVHIISDDFPTPMLLMEIMPNLLAKRYFPPIVTQRMLEPGFREAPSIDYPMAIVFAKVEKPKVVKEAEDGYYGTEQERFSIVKAYSLGLSLYSTLLRKLLKKYHGYECKEGEPGKFTIAFSELDAAIGWACHLQEELLHLDWPEELLEIEGCTEEWWDPDRKRYLDREYGRAQPDRMELVYRGLRVRIGISWGKIDSQKPLNTGRADYFGVVANQAARVMGAAIPGQVFVEATDPPMLRDGSPLFLSFHRPFQRKLLLFEPRGHGQNHLQSVRETTTTQEKRGSHDDTPQQDGATWQAATEQLGAADSHAAKKQEDPEAKARKMVHIRPLGKFDLKGLAPKLLFEAVTTKLRRRSFGYEGGPPLPVPQFINFEDIDTSFLRNNSVVDRLGHLAGQLLSIRRVSPRGSTSPTSIDVFRRSIHFSQSQTPASAGGSFAAGGEAPVRSKSCLYAGAAPDAFHSQASVSSYSHGSPTVGTRGSPVAAGLAPRSNSGSNIWERFRRPVSPKLTHSSRSESAAQAGHMHSLQVQFPRAASATRGPVVIDAAGQSEDESGGTPAAAPGLLGPSAAAAAPRSAPWLVDGTCSDGDWVGAAGMADVHGAGQGLVDPLLGPVNIPRVQTAILNAGCDSLAGSGAASGSVCRSDSGTPFSVLTSDQPSSSRFSGSHPNSSTLRPLAASGQQPYQQLQQQQCRQSAQLLAQSSGSLTCPPAVDPTEHPHCLQPWQLQNESWHEKQHELALGTGALGGVSANGGLFESTTPVSLSTTMTSCMDPDEMMNAQQQAVANMQRMVAERDGSEASMSFTGAAGLKGILAGVSSLRPRLTGSTGGGAKPTGVMSLFHKVMRRRSSAASIETHAGHYDGHTVGEQFSDEGSIDPEAAAVRQQHGMVRTHSASPSSLSVTPLSSAPGSRGNTGGGAGRSNLLSPNAYAISVANVYTHRHSNSSRASSGGPQADARGGQLAASPCTNPAVPRSNAEGSFTSAGEAQGSFSSSATYTYAESSLSPQHCKPNLSAAVAVWQGYGHQQDLVPDSNTTNTQQQQHGQQLRAVYDQLSGPRLSAELSLRAPQGSSSAAAAARAEEAADSAGAAAAAAAAVYADPAEVVPQLHTGPGSLLPQGSDFTLQPLDPCKLAQQDATAEDLSTRMWASQGGGSRTAQQPQQLQPAQQRRMRPGQQLPRQESSTSISEGYTATPIHSDGRESVADRTVSLPAGQRAPSGSAIRGSLQSEGTMQLRISSETAAGAGMPGHKVPGHAPLEVVMQAARQEGAQVLTNADYGRRVAREHRERLNPQGPKVHTFDSAAPQQPPGAPQRTQQHSGAMSAQRQSPAQRLKQQQQQQQQRQAEQQQRQAERAGSLSPRRTAGERSRSPSSSPRQQGPAVQHQQHQQLVAANAHQQKPEQQHRQQQQHHQQATLPTHQRQATSPVQQQKPAHQQQQLQQQQQRQAALPLRQQKPAQHQQVSQAQHAPTLSRLSHPRLSGHAAQGTQRGAGPASPRHQAAGDSQAAGTAVGVRMPAASAAVGIAQGSQVSTSPDSPGRLSGFSGAAQQQSQTSLHQQQAVAAAAAPAEGRNIAADAKRVIARPLPVAASFSNSSSSPRQVNLRPGSPRDAMQYTAAAAASGSSVKTTAASLATASSAKLQLIAVAAEHRAGSKGSSAESSPRHATAGDATSPRSAPVSTSTSASTAALTIPLGSWLSPRGDAPDSPRAAAAAGSSGSPRAAAPDSTLGLDGVTAVSLSSPRGAFSARPLADVAVATAAVGGPRSDDNMGSPRSGASSAPDCAAAGQGQELLGVHGPDSGDGLPDSQSPRSPGKFVLELAAVPEADCERMSDPNDA